MEMSDMFKVFRKEIDWAGRKLVLETGKIARQADGAVWASYGGTTVLATVVFEKKPKPGRFLPADRQLPGRPSLPARSGRLFKREGRPPRRKC